MKKFTLWLLFAFVALVANAGNFSVYLKIDGTYVKESSIVKVYLWNTDNKMEWNDRPQVTNIVTDVDGAKYFKHSFTDSDNKYSFLFICDEKQSCDIGKEPNFVTTDMVITYNGDKDGDKYKYTASTTAPVEPASVYLYGDNYYEKWEAGVKLEYNSTEAAYVYTETNTANLASDFKIWIDGGWYRYGDYISWNLSKNKNYIRQYAEIKTFADENNMKIEDAAKFSSITIKVKKDGNAWKMQVEGTKESTEDLISARWRGKSYNNWTNNNFTKNADGSFTYVVESPAGLADEWGVDITENNGSTWTWYRLPDGNSPEVGTDVTLVAGSTPNSKQIQITDAANYVTVTLTLKKIEGNWILSTSGTAKEKTHTVTMKGAAWSWTGDKFPFTKQTDGTYAYTFTGNDVVGLAQEFAFTIDNKDYSNRTDLEVNTDEAYTMATGQYEKNYKIPSAENYTDITLTVEFTDGTPSLKVTGTGDTSGVESIDNEGVKIVAGKGTITVSGATNVEVYTAGGALVSREAESHVAAGLYIVRTDNKVAKVIVR